MHDQFLITINHPILKNHKAHGQELLPGLAHIDLLYQMFRENGHDYSELELRNLTIYHPIMVGQDYDVMLSIWCTQGKAGQWQIRMEGQTQRNGMLDSEKKLYVTADMHQSAPAQFDETLDLPILEQAANKKVNLHDVYEQCCRQELVHTGFMKAEGTIYETDSAAVMDISLGKHALPSAEGFMFHPTLIDGSAIGSMVLFTSVIQEEQRLFLPLFYESFRATALLQQHCFARVQTSSIQRKHELMYMTMEFFDRSGKKIAHLQNFAGKLVRDPGLINPNKNEVPQLRGDIKEPLHESNEPQSAFVRKAQTFLQQLLADRLQVPAASIDTQIGYYEMGLNSPGLLEVVKAVEAKVGMPLAPTLLFEYTNIAELAAYLAENHASVFSGLDLMKQEGSQELPQPATVVHSTAPSENHAANANEEIAIIGMAGRYPEAKNLHEFWINLKEGKDCIKEVPKSRWDWQQFGELKSPSGKQMSKWGGFIEDHDCFDSPFFRISPREAETMDPQERLFLETCWEAMEDAGYTPKTIVPPRGSSNRRQVGVFVGVMHKDYSLIGAEAMSRGEMFPLSLNYAPIANRVSYFCNFHGPSMAIDTVCSSSLTAVHLALESIKRGECEVALAGGVNLSLHPGKYLSYGMMDMHASDGYCHTFGKDGDGYVSGEGVGTVVLKPLRQAIEDGDHIYAVVKGSSVNHVGSVSGPSVPSPVAQAEVITACLEKSGVDARTIRYVEAHGTGTSLGDPIEIQGLVKAFRQYTEDQQFCAIGSVKSNIGHAESAAGISGLQKAVLQLHHKTLVASLHAKEVNPFIDFAQSPFYVQQRTEEWKSESMKNGQEVTVPRRSGVSSFGASGSNAHIILEEYIPAETKPKARSIGHKNHSVMIPLSAKNKERLQAYAQKVAEFLKGASSDNHPQLRTEEKRNQLQEMLEKKLRGILSSIIHVGENSIEMEQEWHEYGVDLVQITQLTQKLQEELHIQLDIKEFDQSSSIASVIASLLDNHRDDIEGEGQSFADPAAQIDLENVAYTLQVGREGMRERVAFVVEDIPELIGKLEAYSRGENTIDTCWEGSLKPNNESSGFQSWIAEGNIRKMAECWVTGYEVDWEQLYLNNKPRRVPLPTYPFAKNRYWIPESKMKSVSGKTAAPFTSETVIHPLLQRNTSDFSEQRFSSTFTGQEFFLSDHVVKNQRIVPGVAYLEMARAAAEQATAALTEEPAKIQLKNVVWTRPIVVGDQPVQIHIGLVPEENGEISFEIYSESEAMDAEPVVHSQGSVILHSVVEKHALNLSSLQAECGHREFSSDQCYSIFHSIGMDYGSAHQGIDTLYVGEGKVLAKLTLPASVSEMENPFVLHPSLMDSALQASIGLMMGEEDIPSADGDSSRKPSLPFAMEEVEIHNKCTSSMWAYVRYSANSSADDKVQKLDIDLCDDQGTVCVRIKGYSMRVLEDGKPANHVSSSSASSVPSLEPPVGNLMLSAVWDVTPVEKGQLFPTADEQVVIVGGNEENGSAIQPYYPRAKVLSIKAENTIEEIVHRLEELGSIDHMVWIAPFDAIDSLADHRLIAGQDQGVILCFRTIKALLRLGYGSKELGWSVITVQSQPIRNTDVVNPCHASIHGLIGSMAKEYPNWKIRLMDVEAESEWPLDDMLRLPRDRQGRPWVYRQGEWYRQQLLTIDHPPIDQTRLRQGGIYLVIGGAGGIGEAWTEYMIRTYQAQIIWMGRRQKNEEIQAKMDRLAAFGPAPDYITADATQQNALQQAYEQIKQTYRRIDGVVHSAMVLVEESLETMQEEGFRAVLSSKVDVSVNIALVFEKEPLDFVLFFSSLMAVTKAPKQSNYAAGCTFKDAYAHQLTQAWPCAVKLINWGYWSSGQVEESHQEMVETYRRLEQIGIGLIQPPEAMQAVETLLAGAMNQIAFMKITKPIVIEGMKVEEWVDVHPELYPSMLQLSAHENEGLADVAAAFIEERLKQEQSARIRILEIGAGAESTRSLISQKLHAYQELMSFQVFDPEAALSELGMHAGEYDLIITADKLHAAQHIRQAMRNCKYLLKRNGLLLLELSLPLEAWQKVLKDEGYRVVSYPQLIIAESDGVVRKSKQQQKSMGTSASTQPSPLATDRGTSTEDMLHEKSIAYFKQLVGETLKIPFDQIDSSAALEEYGIDSIMIVQMTNVLRKKLHQISTTLFFEYQTIDALVEHFMTTQTDELLALVGIDEQQPVQKQVTNSAATAKPTREQAGSVFRKAKSRRFLQALDTEAEKPAAPSRQDVAIIGLSGRYPQAEDVWEFWSRLKEGKNCITEVPEDRWSWQEYFSEEKGKRGYMYTKWGGFIEDMDKFDPLFFQISPNEAEQMDPQERLFLETAYASMEDAGYTPATLGESRKIGVFVGVMNGNYPAGTSYWSIANRLSYLFNFQGPSLAVDTACSSSLTAIHLALESLYSGTSECAIAGGVNLIVDPFHYIRLSGATMLSAGDCCKSFGDQADGFVDGEGVGAIVLKPLQKAIADGDHIYGVIKGSMLNAGGKTNGYTVPNPIAQSQVIHEALQRAGVDARAVSYIEAHGTGTALGDPIEIAGLTRAFGQDTKDKQFCAIGSAKSNIGHTESAAGIAGLTKILLQMKYGQIAPSLHAEVMNPNIDFSQTPFMVQQQLTEWKRPIMEINGVTKEYPRIAGLSSFGAGGANVHIVIEEYLEKDRQPESSIQPQQPNMIVLSAKNEERLFAQVNRLLKAIKEEAFTNAQLTDVAFTLQVGREALEERLAVIVRSVGELAEKLTQFAEGAENIAELYRGRVKRNHDTVALFADEDMKQTVETWIAKGKYAKLLNLWVKGVSFDWNKLYSEDKPRRVSLPTYPFARERYWIDVQKPMATSRTKASSVNGDILHPLLHKNTSDLYELRYSSSFTGQESFLADHLGNGQRLFPLTAYLEMARAAVKQAAGDREGTLSGIRMTHVATDVPLLVGDDLVQVHLVIYPEDTGVLAYAIYSESKEEETRSVVHSQGMVEFTSLVEAPMLDIPALQAESSEVLTAQKCYELFQGIDQVYRTRGQVLVKLSLPSIAMEPAGQFVLHPSQLESLLQSSRYLITESTSSDNISSIQPNGTFTLEEMEIFENHPAVMYALIRSSDESENKKIDIDICDESGRIGVRIKGFAVGSEKRDATERETQETVTSAPALMGTTMLTPVWNAVSVEKGEVIPATSDQVVIVCAEEKDRSLLQRHYPQATVLPLQSDDSIEAIASKLQERGVIDHIMWVAPNSPVESVKEESLMIGQERGVIQVFRLIKALLALEYQTRDLGWTIITVQAQAIYKKDTVHPTHASIHGLIGSMAKEYPNWKVRLVDLDAHADWPLRDIFALPADAHGNAWAYRGHAWFRQQLMPVQSPSINQTVYKQHGVYVVIGGAGGIGKAWSEYMIRTYQAQIIWIGRRKKDEPIQNKINQLAALGPAPLYIEADATNRESLQAAYEESKKRFGKINGVIHSAIVLLDRSLANMDETAFRAGLVPKVEVSVRMSQVFGEEPLDFVLFFSSINSFTKSPGQSNYASGCAFKDAFAHQLAEEWTCAVKVMNWGYWGSVGIVASKGYQERMEQIGIGSIEPSEGMEALEALLSGPMNQLALMKTTKPLDMEGIHTSESVTVVSNKISSSMASIKNKLKVKEMPTAAYFASETNTDRNSLFDNVLATLIQLASLILKVESEEIDTDIELKEYGFDPVKLTEFSTKINQTYMLELTPAVMMDYPTLKHITEFLVNTTLKSQSEREQDKPVLYV
ncbi:SDR family NAD(P)-dependent oxidoreductase [Brevibacillus porteri]|uniref:Polyketide synthase n=1 Tax=Brevibacillus porteri TaxID=2126350 RepID=A0ABX5FTL6_9BACL|nr:SDR family NAD(P)-dependent oxidoreductase [Brevibacillus porteri]MED1797208.1 SDR family NAD(P)-dependent oxidoreductase [Brevibacillus porteri]MED2133741.1 SDR family NAD(P)-dependent oxidoreductase [Brevibacillus porteri]MED2746913.1 SDR family NAD(P)-dependent oxidoreductase [Brevibacillus porteri]MED2816051.1 SDR family NAD(P)-dependent oxidoreductase [Brevibacillus porteri]MED2894703.1 SDR family NAD(P)-dependent oxidoreductase [Brevibacillus porteri]